MYFNMSVKQINLEEIFEQQNPQDGICPKWAKEFAIEAVKKALKLAAENAEMEKNIPW